MNKQAIWYEIPVKKIERAKEFYKRVFGFRFTPIPLPNTTLYLFDGSEELKNVKGALVDINDLQLINKGGIVYIHCEDISIYFSRIIKAGGQLVFDHIPIADIGFIAHFYDTEGNIIGLHSTDVYWLHHS